MPYLSKLPLFLRPVASFCPAQPTLRSCEDSSGGLDSSDVHVIYPQSLPTVTVKYDGKFALCASPRCIRICLLIATNNKKFRMICQESTIRSTFGKRKFNDLFSDLFPASSALPDAFGISTTTIRNDEVLIVCSCLFFIKIYFVHISAGDPISNDKDCVWI